MSVIELSNVNTYVNENSNDHRK